MCLGASLKRALLQAAQLMVEDLMKTSLQFVVRQIDFFAQVPRVFGDLFPSTQMLGDMAANAVADLRQLGIDHFRLHRLDVGIHVRRGSQAGRGRLARRLGRRRLDRSASGRLPRLRLGLRLGSHLRDPSEKVFDFVFHVYVFGAWTAPAPAIASRMLVSA
jgi:hypothetical protein